MVYKVLIDQHYGNHETSLVSGHLQHPAVSGGVFMDGTYTNVYLQTATVNEPNVAGGTFSAGTFSMPLIEFATILSPAISGNMNFQSEGRTVNMLDGDTMQSASTVSQLNVGVSGCVALMPSGNVTNHNTIVAQSSANVPLVISGYWGGHETNLQTWNAAGNQALVDDSCKISGYGLDAQEQQITNVALVPTLSGHAASMNYVDAQDLIQVNTVVAYSDAQDTAVLAFVAASYQPLNALLTSLSSTVHYTNNIFFTDGANSTKSTQLTPLARTLISGATAEAMRTTLELGDSATLNVGRTSGTVALGNHETPIFFDDFFHTFNASSTWDSTLTGNGNAYNQSNYSYGGVLITDPGDGYYRITNGGGSASTDTAYVKPRDELSWGSIFSGRQRKHVWRAALSSTTSIKGSFGIMGGTINASGVRPGPSYVFVFDSANSNIHFESDDNGGNISSTDTGVTLAADTFWNCEIHAVSGAVTAYIDGAEVATRTSNFPTGNDVLMYPFFWWVGNGANWRSFLVDTYIYYGDRDRFLDGFYT